MNSTEKLQIARQKLQLQDMPFQIRITAYLRICCLILDQQNHQSGRYAKLLKELYHHDENWWQTCQISIYGGLQSSDPIVTDLLQPIEVLHNPQSQFLELQPIAA